MTEIVEYGDFPVEAETYEGAVIRAKRALSKEAPDIDWNGESGETHGKTKIEGIEILANGTEEIKEGFG